MQKQIPDQVSSSEEIYNKMTLDTFGIPEIYKNQEEVSFPGETVEYHKQKHGKPHHTSKE